MGKRTKLKKTRSNKLITTKVLRVGDILKMTDEDINKLSFSKRKQAKEIKYLMSIPNIKEDAEKVMKGEYKGDVFKGTVFFNDNGDPLTKEEIDFGLKEGLIDPKDKPIYPK